MDASDPSFSGFKTLVAETSARGLVERRDKVKRRLAARNAAHPAALLDTRLVFLAMNVPYARMLRLPSSAIVGREYAQTRRGKGTGLELLRALSPDQPLILPPDEPGQAEEESVEALAPRPVTPLLNELAQPLGLVLEYCPAAAAQHGAAG